MGQADGECEKGQKELTILVGSSLVCRPHAQKMDILGKLTATRNSR
jgi:hypothetical protein